MNQADTNIESIEALDFDIAIPCEHSQHKERHTADQPGTWLVTTKCPACGYIRTYPLCEQGRAMLFACGRLAHVRGKKPCGADHLGPWINCLISIVRIT